MEMRLAGIVKESVVDGPGIRMTVFFQGCPHHCPECHNPETHDFNGGTLFRSEDILAELAKRPLLKGITLSGGEPLSQPAAAACLAKGAAAIGKDVMVYSGFIWEDILDMAAKEPALAELLQHTHILIDGLYEKEKRDLALFFRGSTNQRAIDVPKSLTAQKPILYSFYFPAD